MRGIASGIPVTGSGGGRPQLAVASPPARASLAPYGHESTLIPPTYMYIHQFIKRIFAQDSVEGERVIDARNLARS